MRTLGVILARAGSKGLPDKCVRPLLGRPMVAYTIDHARAARELCGCVLSTDSAAASEVARAAGVLVVARPAELASDTATVDAAARHAVEWWESQHAARVDAVVLLYANIPVRAEGAIDRAIGLLRRSGASSVRTVAPVGKHHPDWTFRLEGTRMVQYRANRHYRRQDLEPLYFHDGAVIVVTREALFAASPDDPQSFLGSDRLALVQSAEDAVDVDEPADLFAAEAALRSRNGPVCCASSPATHTGSSATFPPSHLPTFPRLTLGDRAVGANAPLYVIAEAGVNHNGRVEDALRLVEAAAAAGADAVKFQVFSTDELATDATPTAAYQRAQGECSQKTMLRGLELSTSAFERIRMHCESVGIAFLATPFSPRDLERLLVWRPPAIKIASTDLTNVPLVRAAVETGLPLIVSTGAATEQEISEAAARFAAWRARERVILMHCVSAYPTPLSSANLGAIAALRTAFGVPVGFSDHTDDVVTGALAAALGACALEKHLTLDRGQAGPDHAFSLTPERLAEYVALARQAQAARGAGRFGMSAIENEVRSVSRRSVVAAQDLRPGTVLTPELLAVKRPAGGIDPSKFDELLGRVLAVAVARDGLLRWDMLQ